MLASYIVCKKNMHIHSCTSVALTEIKCPGVIVSSCIPHHTCEVPQKQRYRVTGEGVLVSSCHWVQQSLGLSELCTHLHPLLQPSEGVNRPPSGGAGEGEEGAVILQPSDDRGT